MIGVLAGATLAVATILAVAQSRRGARILAFTGLALAAVASALAAETEVRFHHCTAANQRAEDAAFPSGIIPLGSPVPGAKNCDRWPW